jgi:hypothetical protein
MHYENRFLGTFQGNSKRPIRAVKLRAGKSFMERPVQHFYPLELSYDIGNRQTTKTTTELNADATEFRPKRDAAVAARLRNQMIVDD